MCEKINPFLIGSVEHYPHAYSRQRLAGDLHVSPCRNTVLDCASSWKYEGEKEKVLHYDELPLIEPAAL